MKMRAEINWIIPDIMTNSTPESFFRDKIVSHQSPQFFDEKDPDQRKWDLTIQSHYLYFENGEKKYAVHLFVHVQQPKSIFAATYFIVVSDEKGDQPRQLTSKEDTHSPKFIDSDDDDIVSGFVIDRLEEVKKLSKVSVRCIIEYEPFDLKNSVMIPSKHAESTLILDVDQHSTGWIQQDLEKLFKYQSKSDICFFIDGQELRAHKLILSARSPVFAAMIDKAEVEGDLMNGVEIKNMAFTTFKDLIHFIYTDQVCLTEINADSLLAAAQEYSIPLLINKCEEYIYSTSLTVENCSERLITADINKAVHSKKKVVDFICSMSAQVMHTNGWKQLKKSHPDLVSGIMEEIEM